MSGCSTSEGGLSLWWKLFHCFLLLYFSWRELGSASLIPSCQMPSSWKCGSFAVFWIGLSLEGLQSAFSESWVVSTRMTRIQRFILSRDEDSGRGDWDRVPCRHQTPSVRNGPWLSTAPNLPSIQTCPYNEESFSQLSQLTWCTYTIKWQQSSRECSH